MAEPSSDFLSGAGRVKPRSPETGCDQSGRDSRQPQRRECADRTLIVGERHLAAVLAEYTSHYNEHRPHRSLGQRPPDPPSELADLTAARVRRHPILDG